MAAIVVCLAFLVPASVACLYYLLLTTVGSLPTRATSLIEPRHRFTILIPAHNEELGIAAAVRSVQTSDYPSGKVGVLVVADNSMDRTAAEARWAGARCIERLDPTYRGKGYALAFAMPEALRECDAVVVMDADCELPRDALRRFDAALADGAEAVQAARVPRNPTDGPAALVSAVGSAIENAVSAGKYRLGGSVALRGSGMAFTRQLLERLPWQSFGLVEDAEYGVLLAKAGVRVHYLADLEVRGEVPGDAATLARQRTRWRAALFAGGSGLLARWLASKPLVLAHLSATLAAVAVATSWLPMELAIVFASWVAMLVLLTGLVYVRAMRRAGVGLQGLIAAAGIVAKLAWVTLAGFADRGRPWERTLRAAEVREGVSS